MYNLESFTTCILLLPLTPKLTNTCRLHLGSTLHIYTSRVQSTYVHSHTTVAIFTYPENSTDLLQLPGLTMPTEQDSASPQATLYQKSVRSPLVPSSYTSEYSPDNERHVIPSQVKCPYVGVWDPDSKTVYYMPIEGIGAEEQDRARTEYHNVVRHDGGVTFQSQTHTETGSHRWESTPASNAFDDPGYSIPVHLVKTTTNHGPCSIGGTGDSNTCTIVDIETENLEYPNSSNKINFTAAHIEHFKDEATGSFAPLFVADEKGGRDKKGAIQNELMKLKRGTYPWRYQHASIGGTITQKNSVFRVNSAKRSSKYVFSFRHRRL